MDNCAGASGLAVDRHRRPAGSADRGQDREPVDAALAVAPATCHTGSHDRAFRPPTATSLTGPIRLNTITDAHPAKNPYGDPPLLILFSPPSTLIVTATDAQRGAAAVHQLVVAEHAAAVHQLDLRRYGQLELAADEPIRARRNDYQLTDSAGGVLRNGSEWTVTSVAADGITAIRRDDPTAQIRLPADYIRDHVEHGYAISAYRAQGLTCDRTHIVGAEQMTRETMYVALTRARAGGQLYLAAEDRKDALTQLRDTPTRQGEQLAALDVLAGHLDTRRTDRDRSPRPKPVHGHPAGVSPQPTRPGRPDRAARDAAPTAGRASDPETAAVPHWRHRPAGGLAPAQLTAGIDDAQARDQQQAAQATRRRAEADQLGAVLGTADSPARRAQARRWEQLRTAEAHLTVADQHASLSQHARRQANPARNEAEEATRLLGHHDCAGSAVPRHQPARVA